MNFDSDLAYFLGALLGDGTIHTPTKRKCGGVYKALSFAGKKDFLELLKPLVNKFFMYNPLLFKRNDRENTWRLKINSYRIFDFFTQEIGLHPGKKAGNMPKISNLNIPERLFSSFLAGLIDTDGYVTKKTINFTQKDKRFLDELKEFSKNILNIEFRGPYINKKINGIPIAWCLQIRAKESIKYFMGKVPLRYKLPR